MRHSRSFLLSLIVHFILLGLLFISYKKFISTQESIQESRILVPLCCLSTPKESQVVEKVVAKKQEQTKSVEKKIVSKSPLKLKEPPVKEIFNQQKQELTKSLDKPVEEEILERSDQDTVIEDIEKIADEEPETLPVSKASPIEEKKLTQPRKTAQELYIDENLAEITKLLQEHLYYPRSARKRGIEGEVLVKFFLSKSAEVKGIEVLSSQHSILSKGAIETIESLSGVFPMPKEALELTIPINYSLKR